MSDHIEKLKDVLIDSPEVVAAYIFGSVAKNEPVMNDIDLLLLLRPEIDTNNAYFDLTSRIAQVLKINAYNVDIIFFDLRSVDPEILYEAVNHGILIKNDSPKLLTEKIEELSRYFLENEFLIQEANRLRKERLEEFCAG